MGLLTAAWILMCICSPSPLNFGTLSISPILSEVLKYTLSLANGIVNVPMSIAMYTYMHQIPCPDQ
jgi:hypothetical protein